MGLVGFDRECLRRLMNSVVVFWGGCESLVSKFLDGGLKKGRSRVSSML